MNGSKVSTANRKPRTSGIVVPHRPSMFKRLAGFVLYHLARLLTVTIRFTWQDLARLDEFDPKQRVIYCIWHNRLALSVILFEKRYRKRQPDRRLAAMVSASRDGGLLTRILELFGVQPVRGSSSRRGAQALLEMTSWAERNYDLAITPDGPRGPCFTVQEGVIALAQLTGLTIIPVTYQINWKFRLNTWDRFQVPLPFTRCDVIFGQPVQVPREATEEQREFLRRKLEDTLKSLTKD
jgi:lysophospholipid acyltransferase (LPLAT)-like uncharacterized protein